MTRQLKLFAWPILLFIAALSICRLYLYVRYHGFFPGGFEDTLFALAHGVRFDISTAFTASILFLLATLIPFALGSIRFIKPVLYLLCLWQIMLLGYNFADIHFYADTQRHLGYDILYARNATGAIVKMGYEGFLLETVGFLLFLGAYGLIFVRKINALLDSACHELPYYWIINVFRSVSILLLTALFSLVAVRGGIQPRPLTVGDAFVSENEAMGNLSLNGIYTTTQVFFQYYDSEVSDAGSTDLDPKAVEVMTGKMTSKADEIIDKEYPLYRKFRHDLSDRKPMNVVLFIMESWTAKFISSLGGELAATPNFDQLAKEGLLINNCFANGQRTYDGMVATLGSFPTWNNMIIGYSGLAYQTRLAPIGSLFTGLGYETLFIHGSRKDTLGLHKLVKRFGLSNHLSIDELKVNEGEHDGVWGLYDEATFTKAHNIFMNMEKPFFSVVLSLTSHLPFNLPSGDFDKFPNQESPMREYLNSLSYSDYALGKFFDKAKTAEYYNNTLFVIVGDHVAGYFTTENLREAYRIPCLYINAGVTGVRETVSSQYDVVPSILDMLRISEPFTAWGKSVLSEGARASVLSRGGSQVYVDETHMIQAQGDTVIGVYDYRNNPQENIKQKDVDKTNKLYSSMKLYMDFSENLIIQNKVKPQAAR